MKKIVYDLETITPTFCYSASRTVELRPSSFKGLMRYWYRALIAENDVKRLHKMENQLFGSTCNSSSFRIRVLNHINKKYDVSRVRLLPHKSSSSKSSSSMNAIKQGFKFKLELSSKSEKLDEITDIFELSLLLGGIGRRSRRGFGSIANANWEFEDVNNLLEYILNILNNYSSKTYSIDKEKKFISVKKEGIFSKTSSFNYPTIEEIHIGLDYNSYSDLLHKIGKATHDHCNSALGSGSPRMASPVYITINKIDDKYYPVITKLTPCYHPKKIPNNYNSIIDNFIKCVVGQ